MLFIFLFRLFSGAGVRPLASKVLVILIDKKSGSDVSVVKAKAKALQNKGVIVIPVIIGNDVKPDDVIPTTDCKDCIIPGRPTDKPDKTAKELDKTIKKAVNGNVYY